MIKLLSGFVSHSYKPVTLPIISLGFPEVCVDYEQALVVPIKRFRVLRQCGPGRAAHGQVQSDISLAETNFTIRQSDNCLGP